jgi:hypothetical protein
MDELNTQHLNMALHSFLIREWCEGWHFAHMWKTCTSSHKTDKLRKGWFELQYIFISNIIQHFNDVIYPWQIMAMAVILNNNKNSLVPLQCNADVHQLNTQHLNMALHSFLIREWCEGWHFAHMWKTCTSSHNFTNSNGLGRADQFDPVTLLVTWQIPIL